MLDSVLNKKNRMDTFLILICFLKLFECSLVVETNVGLIQGLDNTDGYYEFLGIPYAIVNPENIFGEALPFPVLKHLFYANNSVACPQREEYNNTIIGSLDCLHLNIYVPKSANTTYKLPVLVSIHGGKFEFGFSSKYVFGPKYLVANSIILVTLNYRLGIYGFMCLDIPKVPGNQGLKDQQIALEWIYQNIEYFGGDIRAITVYGQSSGAMSVDLHLQSPHHKLYKRVILQGGVSLMEVNESNRTIPLIVAKHLGLDASNINRALSFLSKIKTETVIEIVDKLNISWRPCVEHDFGQNRFISDFPVNVNRAKVKNVDVIVGVSEIEALLLVDSKSEKYYETFNPFHYYMSKKFSFDNERLIKMENTVRHFYIGERSVSFDVAIDIANFVSDIAFIYPSIRTIKKFIEYDAQNIFLYKFSYEGGRNFLKTIKNMTMPGATHNDDLGYLFDPSFMKNPLTHNDELTVNRMTKLFSNFVRFGNPTPTITDLTPVKWLPVSRDNQNYLNIDNELTSRTGMFHDRIAFWDIFFELNRKYIKFYKSGNNNTVCEI